MADRLAKVSQAVYHHFVTCFFMNIAAGFQDGWQCPEQQEPAHVQWGKPTCLKTQIIGCPCANILTLNTHSENQIYFNRLHLGLHASNQRDFNHINLSNSQSLRKEGVIGQNPTPRHVEKQTGEQR